MSTMVTQLSYNINEKLRLDEAFTPFQKNQNESSEKSSSATKTSSPFSSAKDPCSTWLPKPTASNPYPTQHKSPFISPNATQQSSIAASAYGSNLPSSTGTSGSFLGFGSSAPPPPPAPSRFPPQMTSPLKSTPLLGVGKFRPHLLRQLQRIKMQKQQDEEESDETMTTLYSLQRKQGVTTRLARLHASTSSATTTTGNNGVLNSGCGEVERNDAFISQQKQSPFKQPPSKTAHEFFPTIKGQSCMLHSSASVKSSPVKENSLAPVPTGLPATKRHCRSVSEPDEVRAADTDNCVAGGNEASAAVSASPKASTWKPGRQSQVWRPIRQIQRHVGQRARGSSSSIISTNPLSRSHDCASFSSNHESSNGSSPLTPPDSPVPRPASVTVIKHEGGNWSFLSSRYSVSSNLSFSPLSSPSAGAGSGSSHDAKRGDGKSWSCGMGLSATKRSLSFSDDFEHRESIQYTPASTPELGRRELLSTKGNLLRCQSHPADLNVKKQRTRRRGCMWHHHRATGHNRPTIDFIKQKQTAMGKKHFVQPPPPLPSCPVMQQQQQRNISIIGTSLPSPFPQAANLSEMDTTPPTRVGGVKSNFSCFTSPSKPGNKTNGRCNIIPKVMPMMAKNCKPLEEIRARIPSPTDELPDDDVADDVTHQASKRQDDVTPFIFECADLNVDEIENEIDQ